MVCSLHAMLNGVATFLEMELGVIAWTELKLIPILKFGMMRGVHRHTQEL